jgi:hypothetical protein
MKLAENSICKLRLAVPELVKLARKMLLPVAPLSAFQRRRAQLGLTVVRAWPIRLSATNKARSGERASAGEV